MTTPQDEANAAAERIQQLWRQYRDAVQQFEHASLPRVNSVATFGSATAGSTQGDDAMDDLAQYEAQLNEAAALVQRRWRQYRVEVVTASTEGLEIPQSSYGHAETRDANAPRWHEWSPETDLATARPPQHESHSQRGDDAASRIQRRWKRYREAVRQVEHSQHDQPNEFNIEAAAALIQRRWRQYFRAAREESEVPLRAPRDEDDDEDDEEPMRTQTTEEEDVSARTSNHNPHDAARRIQRLWKRYREAVEQFEDAASTVESNAEDVATAAETIQRRWRQYVAARRRQHTPQRASVGRPARSSSSSSSTSSTEDAADNTVAHLPPPPAPAPPRLFVEGPRDAAALMIQFWWRRRDPSLTPTATDPDRGQRIREALQGAQAEWRGLVDQVRLRDRTEAAVRLQEAWRHHRTVTRYREELAAGRRDAAARSIQLAFRRRSGRGLSPAQPCKPTGLSTASPLAGPRAVAPSQASLPTCIVCLDEVVQMALLPCGHAHLCAECAPALRRCPACRALVSVRIRIYL